jgi:hypothetical protein
MTPSDKTIEQTGQGARDLTSHHFDDSLGDFIPADTFVWIQGTTQLLHLKESLWPPEERLPDSVTHVVQEGPLSLSLSLSLLTFAANFGPTCE